MTSDTLPQHLAIIMDGNGRWAKLRNHHRTFGHVKGALVAQSIIEECARIKIKYLTLFTFSHENWQRPPLEVALLMRLLVKRLRKERESLMRNNIRFRCIGDLNRLPQKVAEVVCETTEMTSHNTGMELIFALSYGGQQDILRAAKKMARDVAEGKISADDIDETQFAGYLATADVPHPDLIVRTSGESRLSNFFLWQAAYSELYVTDRLWPDFSNLDLRQALQSYASRERRFGRTSEQTLEHKRWPLSQPG